MDNPETTRVQTEETEAVLARQQKKKKTSRLIALITADGIAVGKWRGGKNNISSALALMFWYGAYVGFGSDSAPRLEAYMC